MIDLHLHTTASDGRCTPAVLIEAAAVAGVTACAVTDHDTLAALPDARRAAEAYGLTMVPGVEITAVHDERDVHVLAYWVDEHAADLLRFLDEQRARRVDRVERMAFALARAGAPVDLRGVLDQAAARPGAAVGRPALARALVDGGHATSMQDAFDRLLAVGRPGYVSRAGVVPGEAIELVHAAGGVASLAHPGVTARDDMLAAWVADGLDAVEAYHSDHDDTTTSRYCAAAQSLGVVVSGGSDFHGDEETSTRGRRRAIGRVTLPADCFVSLGQRALERRR